ncbi:hypothetical protein D9611_010731 [Ephemerocybe angulata]|uniref:Uncharacterized protein n=1 Tax=Ephemerocybe angulata TaxID=980116 RepID=A0A8H5BDZ2_9AGAR|nr:hypothetical protein D9611_010731 [Tulosesus angulatus]
MGSRHDGTQRGTRSWATEDSGRQTGRFWIRSTAVDVEGRAGTRGDARLKSKGRSGTGTGTKVQQGNEGTGDEDHGIGTKTDAREGSWFFCFADAWRRDAVLGYALPRIGICARKARVRLGGRTSQHSALLSAILISKRVTIAGLREF